MDALLQRLRKLAAERAADIGNAEPCPPEAECDDCDTVRALRDAADAIEGLKAENHQLQDYAATIEGLSAEVHEHNAKLQSELLNQAAKEHP